MNPWLGDYSSYDYSTINKGTNPISKLEVVSSLNFFNLGHWEYHFNYQNCTQKYNPKLYLGAIQTASRDWNYDLQTGQTNGLGNLPDGLQKSGSYVYLIIKADFSSFLILNPSDLKNSIFVLKPKSNTLKSG